MTSKEKLLALAKRCRAAADKDTDQAVKLLDRAEFGHYIAQSLETLVPQLSDADADAVSEHLGEDLDPKLS